MDARWLPVSMLLLRSSPEGEGSSTDCGDKDLAGWDLPGDWLGLCDVKNLSMADYGLHWFREIARFLNMNFRQAMLEAYRDIGLWAIRTPTPGSGARLTLGRPDGGLWAEIYDKASAGGGGKIFTMALLLLVAAVATRQLVVMLDVGSGYRARTVRRNLWSGLILVVCWYWIGVVTLTFAGALSAAFMPSPGTFGETMASFVSFDSLGESVLLNPFITIPLLSLGVFAFLGLKALFLFRNVMLLLYMLGGPVLAALAFSGVPILEGYCRSILGQFVPMAFLSVPAALVFRGTNLLVEHTDAFLVDNPVSKVLIFSLVPVVALLVSLKTFKLTNPVASDLARAPMKWGGRVGMVAGALAVGSPRVAFAAGHSGGRGVARHAERRLFYRKYWGDHSDDQSATGLTDGGNPTSRSRTGRRTDAVESATRSGYRDDRLTNPSTAGRDRRTEPSTVAGSATLTPPVDGVGNDTKPTPSNSADPGPDLSVANGSARTVFDDRLTGRVVGEDSGEGTSGSDPHHRIESDRDRTGSGANVDWDPVPPDPVPSDPDAGEHGDTSNGRRRPE